MSILEKTLRETLVDYEVHIPMSYQTYLTAFDEDVHDDKFNEYEGVGVREYWIIDPRPEQQTVEIWVLDAQGTYQAAPLVNGHYYSTVLPGFWLNPQWLWQPEQYSALAAFAEVAGLPEELVRLLKPRR